MLTVYQARLLACVVAKHPGGEFDGRLAYASGMHFIARQFHGLLELECAEGLLVVDSREAKANARVAQLVCAAKFAGMDQLPRLIEAPLFGRSDDHAGLQVADIVASALVFPVASTIFGPNLNGHPHLHQSDPLLARRYRKRLKGLFAPCNAASLPRLDGAQVEALPTLLCPSA